MTDPELFEQVMDREWDMSLWFGRGRDQPQLHPASIGFTDTQLTTAHALKWATRRLD